MVGESLRSMCERNFFLVFILVGLPTQDATFKVETGNGCCDTL